MELTILTHQGKKTERKALLNDAIFGIQPNQHAVYLDVKRLRANQRQGTHKTKDRSELSHSTRKLQKQKGTGNARKGDANANILRGGATAHGPKPRSYSLKLNKKQPRLARKSALSHKATTDAIRILEDFTLQQPKTKDCLSILQNLGLQNKKNLFILPKNQKNLMLAGRNIPKTRITTADRINTYDLLYADHLIISESSLPLIHQSLQ